MFCHENKLTFPISDQEFENSMDFSLIINESKSHYVYNRFMFHKTKQKRIKTYIVLIVKMF